VQSEVTNTLIASQSTATSLAQVGKNAAVAASGAYAATASIPYIGPILAPAAAAAAYAATIAWGAFEVGAYNLPHDMVGVLHKGEMVVPQTFAEGIRSGGGLGGSAGGGASGNLTLNQHVTVGQGATVSPADLSSALNTNNQNLLDYLTNQMRNGNLALWGRQAP
jgi:hypothetical protein